MEIMASIMKDHILNLLREGKRIDGRGAEDLRPLTIETDVIEKAEGSALVKLGNTQVLVGIKVDFGEPFPDLPEMGVMTTMSNSCLWHRQPLNQVRQMRGQ